MTGDDVQHDFGILTLATPSDHLKALALALSLRKTNPDVPLCLVACKPVLDILRAHFDVLVEEDAELRGFEHKMALDKYSPFKRTLFLDADVLIFRSVDEVIQRWRGSAYAVRGHRSAEGTSAFGLDRAEVLKKIDREQFACIGGAGHCYFESPACDEVFALGRSVMADYKHYAGDATFADEDAMGIAMAILDIHPKEESNFHGRCRHAKRGSLCATATPLACDYTHAVTGEAYAPVMMHFARLEAPFLYHSLIEKLRRDASLRADRCWWWAPFREWFKINVHWRSKIMAARALRSCGLLKSGG